MSTGGSSQRPAKLSFTLCDSGGSPLSGTSFKAGNQFVVQFNPTQLKITQAVNWKEGENYGTKSAKLTYESPKPMGLSMELMFDTTVKGAAEDVQMDLAARAKQGAANVAAAAKSAASNAMNSVTGGGGGDAAVPDQIYEKSDDVRLAWVNHLIAMTVPDKDVKKKSPNTSQPPPVFVQWKDFKMVAVVTKLDTTYTLFGTDGTPLRAKVTLELKEFQLDTPVDTSVKTATPMTAANVQLLNPSHGENVYSLAMQFGLDWRMIALANNIDDPSDIAGNMDLIIPMVTGKNI